MFVINIIPKELYIIKLTKALKIYSTSWRCFLMFFNAPSLFSDYLLCASFSFPSRSLIFSGLCFQTELNVSFYPFYLFLSNSIDLEIVESLERFKMQCNKPKTKIIIIVIIIMVKTYTILFVWKIFNRSLP